MSQYYDWENVMLKHQANMYMVVSGRGVGKTYGLLKKLINQLIENNELDDKGAKILYLRRNKNQIQEAENGFWDAFIKNKEWPNLELKRKGNLQLMNGKPVVELQSLADDMKLKGNGHSTIKYIIFDEFIPGGGGDHYKKNEVQMFQSILSSYTRDRTDVTYFLLGNSLQYTSPYFDEFGVEPVKGQRFNSRTIEDPDTHVKFKILVDHPLPGDIEITSKNNTPLSVLFSNTSYGKIAIGNEAPDSGEFQIAKRDPRQAFITNVKMSGDFCLSVWVTELHGITYLYFDDYENGKETIALTTNELGESVTKVLLGSRTALTESLQINMMRAKDSGSISYRSVKIRIKAIELMRSLSIMH